MPTAPKPDNARRLAFSVPSGFGVDRTKGTFANLSLLTAGREAKGHGIYIDAVTLATGLAAIDARGGRLKGALRHLSIEEMCDTAGDRVLDFPGWFSGISVKGDQLVAEKFEFFETFRTDNPGAYARMLEIAEKTPDLFGLSIEVYGYAVFIAADGTEYGQRPEGFELEFEGLPVLRITEITFAAFVDEPAANDGLFAKFSRVFGGKQSVDAAAVRELAAALSAWAAAHPAAAPLVPSPATTEPRNESFSANMKTIIETITAEFGANPAQFSQAMTILGRKPAITIEALRAEMVGADLSAARDQVASLTAERDTLKTALATANAATATAAAALAALKASGAPGEVNLGAGAGAGNAPGGDNPWAAASVNLTRQCEIERTHPALAATLKAAANVK